MNTETKLCSINYKCKDTSANTIGRVWGSTLIKFVEACLHTKQNVVAAGESEGLKKETKSI